MACKCAPALVALRNELNIRYPTRDKASDGCCGDAAHQARVSDHNPDRSGYAHAHDFDEDLSPSIHSVGFLVPLLLSDPRTKYVIYEKLIYKAGNPVGRPYTGANPHDKHLHLSIVDTATFDIRPWLTALDKPEPEPPPEDDDMPSPAQEALAQTQLVEAWYRDLALRTPDPAGFDYWLGLLEKGGDPEEVRKAFTGAVVAA